MLDSLREEGSYRDRDNGKAHTAMIPARKTTIIMEKSDTNDPCLDMEPSLNNSDTLCFRLLTFYGRKEHFN
jgi:hypothetical protein